MKIKVLALAIAAMALTVACNNNKNTEVVEDTIDTTAIEEIVEDTIADTTAVAEETPVVATPAKKAATKEVKKEATRSWKPLNTESVTTRAIVATATPTTEMALMTLMAWVDFFEKR